MDEDMTFPTFADGLANQADESITRLDCSNFRTGLTRSTSTVDLARGNARQTNARPLLTPNWTIAIPYAGGRT